MHTPVYGGLSTPMCTAVLPAPMLVSECRGHRHWALPHFTPFRSGNTHTVGIRNFNQHD